MVRKMAYCKHCNKMRKIEVELTCIASYDPQYDIAEVHGFGDIIIRCSKCYGGISVNFFNDYPKKGALTSKQAEELLDRAANKTRAL